MTLYQLLVLGLLASISTATWATYYQLRHRKDSAT